MSIAFLAAAAACGTDALLQGDGFAPDGTLPTEPPSVREGGAACDGSATCDASAADVVTILPSADGAAPPSNTCQTARAFGTLSGDTGLPHLSTTGKCSEWLSFRATEDNSSAIGAPMKAKLLLTSTGHDFDLFVFFSPSKDEIQCSTPFAMSEMRGTSDEISLTWGEGTVANGSDDGRTIVVGVQSAMGPCPAGAGWSLDVSGNQ